MILSKEDKETRNMKQTTIKVHSNWFGGERNFKVTEIEYIKVKIEMVNEHGEVISEFPLTWKGLTYDEAIQRIKDMTNSIRGSWEIIE